MLKKTTFWGLVTTLLLGIFLLIFSNSVVHAEEDGVIESGQSLNEPPVIFENTETIDQVIEQIDAFYSNSEWTRAAAGTKWANGTKEWDGAVGHYVTNYYWVKGGDMASWNIVGNAQRQAVIAKYGKVNKNTSYKMKTRQHINKSTTQIQGYITDSVRAWCYDKD